MCLFFFSLQPQEFVLSRQWLWHFVVLLVHCLVATDTKTKVVVVKEEEKCRRVDVIRWEVMSWVNLVFLALQADSLSPCLISSCLQLRRVSSAPVLFLYVSLIAPVVTGMSASNCCVVWTCSASASEQQIRWLKDYSKQTFTASSFLKAKSCCVSLCCGAFLPWMSHH